MTTEPIKHVVTNESVTVHYQGKVYTTKKGTPNFLGLRAALIDEKWDDVPGFLTIQGSLKKWSNDKFTIDEEGEVVTFNGEELPTDITNRITSMAAANEDPTPLFKFWERLQKNPSFRSVKQLYSFMKHAGIPITNEGKILTYKSVRADYKDVHSGTFDNTPGTTQKMPRNQISDDPQVACHEGFHVGAMGYVSSFHGGGKIVICEVDPEHVVCVPYDHNAQKVRVCEYKVIGNYSGQDMPDTAVNITDYDTTREPEDDVEPEENDNEISDSTDDEDDEGIAINVNRPEDDEDDDEGLDTAAPDDASDEDEEDDDGEGDKEEEEPKKKAKPAKAEVSAPSDLKTTFKDMGKEDLIGLNKRSIDQLRKYLTYDLKITGASKIPGGKTALVAKIVEVRDGHVSKDKD